MTKATHALMTWGMGLAPCSSKAQILLERMLAGPAHVQSACSTP